MPTDIATTGTTSRLQPLIRAVLHRLLADLATNQLPAEVVDEAIGDAAWTAKIRVEPAVATTGPAAALSAIEQAIMDNTTAVPVSPKIVARKAGYAFSSYFREDVKSLARRGLVRRLPDGLARP